MKFIGVDGCKIGWFYTAIHHENVKLKGTLKNMPEIPLIGVPPTRLSGLLFFMHRTIFIQNSASP
jgi:hypothetical protein